VDASTSSASDDEIMVEKKTILVARGSAGRNVEHNRSIVSAFFPPLLVGRQMTMQMG